MPRFYIEYRGEFAAETEADDETEAMKKFASGNCLVEIVGALQSHHFQISELHPVKKG